MDSVDKTNLSIICGVCCAYDLLYCNWPFCCGCATLVECLCLGSECCLKCDVLPFTCCDEERKDVICQVGCICCRFYFKRPTTCVKVSSQFLFLVHQLVFPCDSSMPCIISLCCWTMHPTCGCCVSYGDVEKHGCIGYCLPPVSPTKSPSKSPAKK